MNIPIYRAKKVDSDEYVEGWPSPAFENRNNIWMTINLGTQWGMYEIDPSTLEISIDCGENFYSISFITRAIEDHIEVTGIFQ